MSDPTQVEYLEIKQQKQLSSKFLWIVLLSICIMAVVSLLITFVYLVTVDKMTPEEKLKEEVNKTQEGLDSCIANPNISEHCAEVFNGVNIYQECEKHVQRDNCFYKVAETKKDRGTCDKINIPEIRSKCYTEMQIGPIEEQI